ncbi:MAG: TIGR03936 family radical SAM-associated protein [Rubripirellula sp.]|nr:TIGR03936 family radical SAM-associated protein [Rubripirellula sp.]
MTIVTETTPAELEPDSDSTPELADAPLLRIRFRIRFGKTDLLRWISHRDLARLWERLLRRAQLKLSMTEGFHPKPRVAFPSALALGVESLDEVVEIELAEEMTPQDLLLRLEADQQPGLIIKSVRRVPEGAGKAQLLASNYTISLVDGTDAAAVQEAIDGLMQQDSVSVERKKKKLTVNVAEQITQLGVAEGVIQLRLAASDAASLRPGDVLDLLGFGDWIERGTLIRRTCVDLQQELDGSDPDFVAVAPTSETALNEQDSCGEAGA